MIDVKKKKDLADFRVVFAWSLGRGRGKVMNEEDWWSYSQFEVV